MKKAILHSSLLIVFNLALVTLNCAAQDFTCVYEMSGINNTCHGSNDAQVVTTIPVNPYPSLAHHVYYNGVFVSDVQLAGFAGQTFYSPVYFDGHGVGLWEYYGYYIDDLGQEVSCNFHSVTVTDPACSYGATTTVTNISEPSCSKGKIKVTFSGTFSAYPHVQLYDGNDSLLQDINLVAGTTDYSFTKLNSGKYTVKTFDATCCEQDMPVKVKCPSPESGFSTDAITATSANVSWNTVGCAGSYKVQYRVKGTTEWLQKSTTGNVGTKTIMGLTPDTKYQWRVGSKCINSDPTVVSDYSEKNTFTTNPLRLSEESFSETTADGGFEMTVAPNPVADLLFVDFITDGYPQFEIVNSLGQIVLKQNPASGENGYHFQLDVSTLQKGIYILLVKTENGIGKERFVKD